VSKTSAERVSVASDPSEDSSEEFFDAHEDIDQELLDMLNLDRNMQSQGAPLDGGILPPSS
jgi:hypothetical protein